MSDEKRENLDSISGEAGAHPVGTGIGATGGAMGGPLGAVVVGVTGAVAPMDSDDVVAVLNDLLETCRDGEYSFNACAEHSKTPSLKTVFEQRSKDCTAAALELYGHILRLGGKPKDGGTASGAVHRGWAAVRGVLSGYSDYAVLDECERGEDMALAQYRKALKQALPTDIRLLVERQMQGAQRNHDQIKALRDEYKQGR